MIKLSVDVRPLSFHKFVQGNIVLKLGSLS